MAGDCLKVEERPALVGSSVCEPDTSDAGQGSGRRSDRPLEKRAEGRLVGGSAIGNFVVGKAAAEDFAVGEAVAGDSAVGEAAADGFAVRDVAVGGNARESSSDSSQIHHTLWNDTTLLQSNRKLGAVRLDRIQLLHRISDEVTPLHLGCSHRVDFSREELGISTRAYQDAVRLARNLATLPLSRRAFRDDIVPESKILTILPVATPENEWMWLGRCLGRSTDGVKQLVRAELELRAGRDAQGDEGGFAGSGTGPSTGLGSSSGPSTSPGLGTGPGRGRDGVQIQGWVQDRSQARGRIQVQARPRARTQQHLYKFT